VRALKPTHPPTAFGKLPLLVLSLSKDSSDSSDPLPL
jgi:hypothetical protein